MTTTDVGFPTMLETVVVGASGFVKENVAVGLEVAATANDVSLATQVN